MPESAIVLANGLLQTIHGKTAHGLIRGPSRYRIAGVVDPANAGRDAGELLDGRARGIAIFDSVAEVLAAANPRPTVCVMGVATAGGVLPDELLDGLRDAAEAGLTLVNGLHRLLSDIPELARITRERGSRIVDLRKPRPTRELKFWSGEILAVPTPRIAVLGMDCAIGKRTTACMLVEECRLRGASAELVYTGQTGWLQGMPYGFLFDATPNDFVSGELERAILDCHREANPDVIFLEGQSGLRNPTGPCGAEFILSAAARGVILQHAPGREHFADAQGLRCPIPPVEEELELIRLLGSEVWGLALNEENLDPAQARQQRQRLEQQLRIPVVLPLRDGVAALVDEITRRIAVGGS